MFNKNTPEGGSIDKKDIETIIGASVKVEGNFSCEGNMIIDGQVKGNVQTNGFLQVGRTAIVIADVKAGNSKIGGEIRGPVDRGGRGGYDSGGARDGIAPNASRAGLLHGCRKRGIGGGLGAFQNDGGELCPRGGLC